MTQTSSTNEDGKGREIAQRTPFLIFYILFFIRSETEHLHAVQLFGAFFFHSLSLTRWAISTLYTYDSQRPEISSAPKGIWKRKKKSFIQLTEICTLNIHNFASVVGSLHVSFFFFLSFLLSTLHIFCVTNVIRLMCEWKRETCKCRQRMYIFMVAMLAHDVSCPTDGRYPEGLKTKIHLRFSNAYTQNSHNRKSSNVLRFDVGVDVGRRCWWCRNRGESDWRNPWQNAIHSRRSVGWRWPNANILNLKINIIPD